MNLLRENTDLFSADRDGFLDLIEDYFDYQATEGKLQPSILSHPAISRQGHEYSLFHKPSTITQKLTIKNTIILDDGDDLGPVEYHGQTEPDESDHEEETPQTAADIVSASLVSGGV